MSNLVKISTLWSKICPYKDILSTISCFKVNRPNKFFFIKTLV